MSSMMRVLFFFFTSIFLLQYCQHLGSSFNSFKTYLSLFLIYFLFKVYALCFIFCALSLDEYGEVGQGRSYGERQGEELPPQQKFCLPNFWVNINITAEKDQEIIIISLFKNCKCLKKLWINETVWNTHFWSFHLLWPSTLMFLFATQPKFYAPTI